MKIAKKIKRYEMKKAIVTGATGFIGKWLTRELVSQGIEVYALVLSLIHISEPTRPY